MKNPAKNYFFKKLLRFYKRLLHVRPLRPLFGEAVTKIY